MRVARTAPMRGVTIELASTESLPARTVVHVSTPEFDVAIFNVDGRLFALDDGCLRCGDSLASGALGDGSVTCARCGWTYDIATGRVHGVRGLCTDAYAVRVVGPSVVLDTCPLPDAR